MKTMSMRIWSHSAVALLLMAMAILTSVGHATGRSGSHAVYRSPDMDDPWVSRHFSSERRDQKDWRDLTPLEPRSHNDPEILFQRLDDMEQKQIGAKSKILSSGRDKSENFLVDSKSNAAHLLRDDFSRIPTDSNDPGMFDGLSQEREDPFQSLARMHFNEDPLKHSKEVNQEIKRMLGYYREKERRGKPAVATANLLAEVISSKVDQPNVPLKSQTCPARKSRPTSTTKITSTRRPTTSTTPRGPTTFCLPDPTPEDRSAKPMDLPPPNPKPCQERVKPSNPNNPKKPKPIKPEAAKMMLEIILATKQHALSVLKNLNYLEMELLGQSADDCPWQDLDLESESSVKERPSLKKTPERLEKPKHLKPNTRVFSFGIRPASQSESLYDLALAKEEELKLGDRVWEEHQHQLRQRRPIKPKRFEAAPEAAARLEPLQEPRRPIESIDPSDPFDPEEPLEPKAPAEDRRINLQALSVVVKPVPRKDVLDPEVPWNPPLMSQAEVKTIRVESSLDDELQPSKEIQKRKRKRKKHKFYAQKNQPTPNSYPPGIAGVFY
ncbi:pollen-specific leucine-rich repeat extensin-like protein 1 [Drosophila rhopaloa]|uniref:Uncharacterized protein n=1 Tax=Drosophila rhopaloa TaxID=1041015 RepID=A0ABM5H6R9_DRORH|nr:pollen-specific leucine-rich repeat extensin-like protein 1 [Drosophila rhopaloa]